MDKMEEKYTALYEAVVRIEQAINTQSILQRVQGRLLTERLGVSDELMRKLYIVEAVHLIGGTSRFAVKKILEDARVRLATVLGVDGISAELEEEILQLTEAEFKASDKAEKEQNMQIPEEAIVFSASN